MPRVPPVSEAGFTILAADADGKAWGDATSVADYRSLIARTQRRYRLHDVTAGTSGNAGGES